MVNKIKKRTQKKIWDSAIEEFSTYGFGGARVDRIAQQAGVNKALFFYYFSSKENLYQLIIKDAVKGLIQKIQNVLEQAKTPERFYEIMPEAFIRYFSQKQYLPRMILLELVQNPDSITSLIRDIFASTPNPPPEDVKSLLAQWSREGKITESDPVQFIMNIIPVSLFWLIGSPMVESVLDVKIEINEAFIQKRIQSVTNLLKRGMLK
ncbi:TetR/AcrR family transcriptional regulator [bacterium]|nr:TetR/AcrR family transcriptional regulator [bacterium]